MEDLSEIMRTLAPIPWVFVSVGIAVVMVGILVNRRATQFDQRAIRVPGVVVGHSWGWTLTGQARRFPVLAFQTVEGRPVQATAMHAGMPGSALPGERVMVLYDPNQPTRARLDGRALASGGCASAVWVVFGVMFLLLGLATGAIMLVLWRLR